MSTPRTPRQQILDAANAARSHLMLPRLGARHINEAVCIVRRRRLVQPEVLVAAGFNAEERR